MGNLISVLIIQKLLRVSVRLEKPIMTLYCQSYELKRCIFTYDVRMTKAILNNIIVKIFIMQK